MERVIVNAGVDDPVDWVVFDLGGVRVNVAAMDASAHELAGRRGGSFETLKPLLVFESVERLSGELSALGIDTGVTS